MTDTQKRRALRLADRAHAIAQKCARLNETDRSPSIQSTETTAISGLVMEVKSLVDRGQMRMETSLSLLDALFDVQAAVLYERQLALEKAGRG